MKKPQNSIPFVLVILVILFSSGCKKNDVTPNSGLGTMPAHFVQRVMLEEVTGEWCGECPDGASILSSLQQQYGDTLVPVSIHYNDFLDMSATYNAIPTAFGQANNAFPTGAVNRVQDPYYNYQDFWYSRAYWAGGIAAILATDHQTGIALKSSISGNNATVEVHIGFHEANNYNMILNVFLVENNIPAQNQTSAPAGYVHQQVLRCIATPVLGDPISMGSVKEIVKTYTVPITGYVASNLVFAVSVEKWGDALTDREVYNARQVKVGQNAMWQ